MNDAEIKAQLKSIQKDIDNELLRKSMYDNGAGISATTITALEQDLARINNLPMSIDAKVEVKKLQLRLQSYKNNMSVMKVAKESEEIGAASLVQLKVQTEQLQRIDSGIDTVDANVERSHQVIKEMHRRRRRMFLLWTAVILLVITIAVVVVVLTLKL